MKSLLILVLSLSSSLVFANSEPQVDLPSPSAPKDSTRMETLESWFNLGSPLTFKEFKGFYSGRCFRTNAENTPVASMVGYYVSSSNSKDDAGPGFSTPDTTKIIYGFALNGGAADRYDDEKTFESSRQQFINMGAQWDKHISNYYESPTLGYTGDWEPNGNPDEGFEFVKYNDYIVMKNTALFRQKYADAGLLNPGDTITMCYYFKKLSN